MYDFYGNPPSTRAQVREYYETWFQDVSDSTTILIGGESFQVVKAFVRAFHIHSVLQNITTGAYAFVAFAREDEEWANTAIIKQYPTYDKMLNALVDDTCKSWKIDC